MFAFGEAWQFPVLILIISLQAVNMYLNRRGFKLGQSQSQSTFHQLQDLQHALNESRADRRTLHDRLRELRTALEESRADRRALHDRIATLNAERATAGSGPPGIP